MSTEIREKNEELRTTAPIPKGQEDLSGLCFANKHNGIIMQIVGHWVSDRGIVVWKSDAGDVYGSIEIFKHWDRIGKQVFRLVTKRNNRGEEE